jgi:hypothetical protein
LPTGVGDVRTCKRVVTLPTGVSSVRTCSGVVKRRGGVARTERRTLVARWGCEDGEARWGGGVGRRGRSGEEEAKRRGGSCEEWWQSHCARIRVNEGASAGARARGGGK